MIFLIRTPDPYLTESLRGYILRVSELNGYTSPYQILNYAGYNLKQMNSAGFNIENLALILGKSLSKFPQISYCKNRGDGTREYYLLRNSIGKSVSFIPFRLNKIAFCPYCVEENKFLDAFWDLKIAVACPIHRCTLLSQCPKCGNKLRWFRPGLMTCHCGEKITDFSTRKVEQPLVDFMSILYAKVHGQPLHCNNSCHLPISKLEEIPLRSLLVMMPLLGKFSLLNEDLLIKFDIMSVIWGAVEILKSWPYGYYDFLRRLGKHYVDSEAETLGLRKRFEKFYISLFKDRAYAEDYNFLRDEFIKFGNMEWGDGIVDKKLMRGKDQSKRFISQSELARQMDVRPATIRKWVNKGKIHLRQVGTKKRKNYVADINTISIPDKKTGQIFTLRAAAKYIGIPIKLLKNLRKNKVFLFKHSPQYKRGFHKDDLDYFSDQLIKRSILIEENTFTSDQLITFDHIMKKIAFWSETGKCDFIVKYINGEIESVGRNGCSIQDILFVKKGVDVYANKCRDSASDGAMSRKAASDYIHCDFDAILGLINMGYLQSFPGPDRVRVSRHSVEDFSKKFLSMSRIAKKVNTSSTRLDRLCKNSSIPILSIPMKRKVAVPFLQRRYLKELLRQSHYHPARPKPGKLSAENYISRPIAALTNYLNEIKENVTNIPKVGNRFNKKVIAQNCGFSRNYFYSNSEALRLLKTFSEEYLLKC